MPDYAEVAGVANAYANGMGHQSHTSTSPLYDSCGAYATTSLIGTTNIYHQSQYQNQQQPQPQIQSSHYNNVIRNGPFVYPNKKSSSTSLNTPKHGEEIDNGGEKLNNTFGGNRNNTLSYGIRNRLMKMNITENKMDILINNNLSAKGSVNGSVMSIQKPSTGPGATDSVNPIPPPTPNLGSTRRNQFLGTNGQKMKKRDLFPNEAPPAPLMKSYLDPETDEDEVGVEERSCDRVNGNSINNNNNMNHNNNNNSTRSGKSQRQLLSGGDNNNQSLVVGGKNPANKSSNKSLNSSSSSPYHMINHRRNGQSSAVNGDSSSTASTNCLLNNGGGNHSSGSSNSSTSSPLMKKNFAGSDNQINGSPNYMKSFGKTDNV